ncbi:hypothetical protein LF65_02296 [Clostridium beijerinckii]|uniref:Uncharacterized protein n=1 Tax=Clostridium beijerinckii TaxID=1520 RepID=A0A0B5QLK4_CLOBE|nr:hypothetical protein [Clostridium beijerinckii]AJG98882.1 hypothetical protein LF65_02296 [Clostridium beijerinckii]
MNNYFKKIILFFCIFCAFVMPLRSNIAKANPIAIGAVEFAEGSLGGVVTGGAGYAGYDIIDRYKKEASDFIIKKSLSTLTNTFLKFYSDSSGQKYVGIDGTGLDELQSMLNDFRHSSIPVSTNYTTSNTSSGAVNGVSEPYMLNGFYMVPFYIQSTKIAFPSFKVQAYDTVNIQVQNYQSSVYTCTITPAVDTYYRLNMYNAPYANIQFSKDDGLTWSDYLYHFAAGNAAGRYIGIGYTTTSNTVYVPATDVITGTGIDGKASDSVGDGVVAVPISCQYQDDGTVVYTPIEGASVGVVSGLTKDTSNSTDIDDNYEIKINRDSIDRIFNSKQGHLTSNTAENRKILELIANNAHNYIGMDDYENEWYTSINSDGTQTWVEVTNNEIVNGGINEIPIKFELTNSADDVTQPNTTTGAAITISEKNKDHIFREASGHLTEDTPENRKILEDVANNEENYLGSDKYGNEWYAKVNEDGTQTWVQVRGTEIRNGGVNELPIGFDINTGLSSPVKP